MFNITSTVQLLRDATTVHEMPTLTHTDKLVLLEGLLASMHPTIPGASEGMKITHAAIKRLSDEHRPAKPAPATERPASTKQGGKTQGKQNAPEVAARRPEEEAKAASGSTSGVESKT
jgi:hypothetical protein